MVWAKFTVVLAPAPTVEKLADNEMRKKKLKILFAGINDNEDNEDNDDNDENKKDVEGKSEHATSKSGKTVDEDKEMSGIPLENKTKVKAQSNQQVNDQIVSSKEPNIELARKYKNSAKVIVTNFSIVALKVTIYYIQKKIVVVMYRSRAACETDSQSGDDDNEEN
uniref:Prothymosin alpha-like n=1 Tax=Heterorhabditis bacteriophora TaxID=37862 RepID=A0A1I7W8Z7_HETBA